MSAVLKIAGGQAVTMTSLELVDFINLERSEKARAAGVAFPSKGHARLEHSDFMKKVPEVLGEGVGKFSDTYVHPQNGQRYPIYRFPKREACLMAMSYSYELQAKVFDRMTALEEAPYAVPKTFSEALRLAANQQEVIDAQNLTILDMAPKAEFHDHVADARNTRTIEDIAHMLKLGRNTLYRLLRENRYLKRCNTPYQRYLDDGHFIVVTRAYTTPRGQKRIDAQTLVAGKGLIAIQKVAAAYFAGKGKPVPSLSLDFGIVK